ncbi:type II toxin-antitoxin system RelE/ParE family toxin [Terricaulis silvestris]|uniref:Toxin n=1 Tax=Terricaulis silvestris TaxID=2686094 RepID=A0A6I6MNV3_9CAUL|nr:type II toxin-antitoxin system RelE/ParE family toxin [Terricaulis silvestris]QGZ94604.1 Toxin ParE1 [Terricaulis silvestris]
MARYTIRERAQADLIDIWRFTSRRWDLNQADSYYREIISALEAVAQEPSLGRPCDEIRHGYRRHNVGSHVVFYRLESGIPDVIRILHGRRDFRRHLPKS